jgi:SagB-type dehydrogenase family enzyme
VKKTAQKKTKSISKISLSVKRWIIPALTALVVISLAVTTLIWNRVPAPADNPVSTGSAIPLLPATTIQLPNPDLRSSNSLEAVLKNRRTRRDFQDKELTLKQVSQMLWAAQGVTVDWGGRTTPSAKSTYPLSVFLLASKVQGLEAGEYQYLPGDRTPIHALKPIKNVDLQKALYETLNESSFKTAPAVLVITGSMGKMSEAYGGIPHDKEVYLEAGHAAQNLYLEAESLHLGMVTISSFSVPKIKDLVTIPETDTIIYLIPFGIPKQ